MGERVGQFFSDWHDVQQMLASFGVIGAIGVMLAYVATILFLPAALMGMSEPPAPEEAKRDALETGIFGLTRWVLQHSKRVLVASLLCTSSGHAQTREGFYQQRQISGQRAAAPSMHPGEK